MMNIRLSVKLATKLKIGKLPSVPLADNPINDWSAHLFTSKRSQYIILCNTMSMYSCLMFGKSISDKSTFIARTLSTIREFMDADGNESVYDTYIAPSNDFVTFAKALNRSVTGSMNDHIHGAKLYLEMDKSPHDVGFQLNKTPLSSLANSDGRKYANPNEAFALLKARLGEPS